MADEAPPLAPPGPPPCPDGSDREGSAEEPAAALEELRAAFWRDLLVMPAAAVMRGRGE